jgi:hypothetical protein
MASDDGCLNCLFWLMVGALVALLCVVTLVKALAG